MSEKEDSRSNSKNNELPTYPPDSSSHYEMPSYLRISTTEIKDKGFWRRATLFQFIYSIAGLVFGLACVIGGMILFFHGVTGSTSWTTKILGLKSDIADAAPGVILFIVGLFVAWITRFEIKAKK